MQQLSASRPTDSPTFFFIDIQPAQVQAFSQFITTWTGGTKPEFTPLVRSRLHAVHGAPVSADSEGHAEPNNKTEGRTRWYVTREYVLTVLEDLPKDNTVVAGAWWGQGANTTGSLVSMEQDAATHLGLAVGDTLALDIQGTILSATVASIRKVQWGNFSTNFYMILSPGSLDNTPMTYVGTIKVAPEEEAALQQGVVADFPNVTAINVGEVLGSFARIVDHLTMAIQAMALFCLMTGALVMASSLAATKYRRLYESVVFKALGASRGLIVRSFAAEFAVLGAVAGMIGVLLASGLSWGLLYFVLDVPWTFEPTILALGLVLTVIMTLSVGFLSTYRILDAPPLSILRQQ